jgi:AraC family transcriptional regulator
MKLSAGSGQRRAGPYPDLTMTIDAELDVPVAMVQLARFSMAGPSDYLRRERETYRLDLSLTPRPGNSRACYRNWWSPSRFERVGTVFVVPPGEAVQARSDGDSVQTSVVCHLRPDPMREWFGGDLKWTDRRLEATLDIRDANIHGLLLRLAKELREPGFASNILVESIAAQIAIELGRYCTAIKEGPPRGGLAPWRLRLIDERLRELGKAPKLPELARLCCLSVRQLTRGFRASRGISIGDYVASCQLDHAKQLLSAGQSAKSVAYSLGFASAASFCYSFRQAAGVTPRQFRQRVSQTR